MLRQMSASDLFLQRSRGIHLHNSFRWLGLDLHLMPAKFCITQLLVSVAAMDFEMCILELEALMRYFMIVHIHTKYL